MRIGLPRLEWLLVALNVVVVGCLVVLFVMRDPRSDDVAESTSSGTGAAVPVLVVVAAGSAADAAVARPAAEVDGGQLLALPTSGISTTLDAALSRSRPDRIVVVGGPAAVTDATFEALGQYTSGTVTRIAGAHRYETAAKVALSQFTAPVPTLRVVSGQAASGPFMTTTRSDAPLLLIRRDGIPEVAAAALAALRPERIEVLGTRAEVTDATVRRLVRTTSAEVDRG